VLVSATGDASLTVHTRAAVTQSQSPTGALGGSGEAPEEVKAVAEEAEAATAAAALRQRAEAAELRAEVAERQLAAANAALVAAGLLLSPTERIPSVSPPTTETAGSAASVGQADRAVHEAPMPTMDRATAKLSSVRAVASAVGGASEESTEEARHSAADPSAQTTREESGVASGSENDDEAEMDAVWMQAADELMAGSNSDDSDGSLVCAALFVSSLQANRCRGMERVWRAYVARQRPEAGDVPGTNPVGDAVELGSMSTMRVADGRLGLGVLIPGRWRHVFRTRRVRWRRTWHTVRRRTM
jgi:hypothetical protein